MTNARSHDGLAPRPGRLYGRDVVFATIDPLLASDADDALLLQLVGHGGVGKTRLLEAIEARLQGLGGVFLSTYDFYHVDYFPASKIEDAIIECLHTHDPGATIAFAQYQRTKQALDLSRMSGAEFEAKQRQARATFISCYNDYVAGRPGTGPRMTLLFDTVEQSVHLSDGVEPLLQSLDIDSASEGGDAWLRVTLPQLRRTLVVLSGRPQTIFGVDVALYGQLAAAMPSKRVDLEGLSFEDTVAIVADILAQLLQHPNIQTRDIAKRIELNEPKLRCWHEISGGLPFWIAIFFSIELLGEYNNTELHNAIERRMTDEASSPLDMVACAQLRQQCMTSLLDAVDPSVEPSLLAIQAMASLRKGATKAILTTALAPFSDMIPDLDALFTQLRSLLVVKERPSPRLHQKTTQQDHGEEQEVALFLHDELYYWLDLHPPSATDFRQSVSTSVRDWYRARIADAEAERLGAVVQQQQLAAHNPQVELHERRRDNALKRRHQLERDLLSYAYQADREQADAMYSLLAFEAIMNREAEHGVALRQEALRNMYRLFKGVSQDTTIDCMARWLLRYSIQNENRPITDALLGQLGRFYAQEDTAHPRLPLIFLRVAEAYAQLFLFLQPGAGRPDPQALLAEAAKLLEAEVQQAGSDALPTDDPRRQWREILQTVLNNVAGYAYRRSYQLHRAIEMYRRAEGWHRRQRGLLPFYYGTTLNNLSFALSEQGELNEARRYGNIGLQVRLLHSTAYDIAISQNTMARIELRAGHPRGALRYAQRACDTVRSLQSERGMMLCLPVLAEAHRKVAELTVDSWREQDAGYKRGLETLHELELSTSIAQQPAQARELYQTRGCIYRSWGLALERRRQWLEELGLGEKSEARECRARARTCFSTAHRWLTAALQAAEKEAPLVRVDINEDLAAVHVNGDEYDERVYEYLADAAAEVPFQYLIQRKTGVPNVAEPTHGYWRELGQIELQRTMCAFGKYDFGFYSYDKSTGRRVERQPPSASAFLDEAALHMVCCMAYLVQYAHHSTMLITAQELMLRELVRRTSGELDQLAEHAYAHAEEYGTLRDASFAIIEQLIDHARRERALAD